MEFAPHSLVVPVVLAGGEGLRLAPLSTPERPKPFVPLPDGKSLLTHTLQRLDDRHFAPPILVGAAAQRYALMNHARDAGVKPSTILLEPMGKNTALAVAVAVAHAQRHLPEAAVLVIVPADHAIGDVQAWRDTILGASHHARRYQQLCLLGVKPTGPDANFGYMVPATSHAPYRIAEFVEKPEKPQDYIDRGALWNTGHFIGPQHLLARLLATHAPAIWEAAQKAVSGASTEWEFQLLSKQAYENIEKTPFDRAVVEHTTPLALRLPTAWSDLGTIAAWERITGEAVKTETTPVRIDRPWGFYECIAEAEGRLEKRLSIFPECRLSRQMHQHRSEYWNVLQGVANIECDGNFVQLRAGESISIPAGSWHRLENTAQEMLVIHEIQDGRPDEADIIRSDDDYGRFIKYAT